MQEIIWNESSLEDRNLVSRSKDGDQDAFEALVCKYQRHLSILVHRHAGSTADEDDLLQLLMCKVYFSLMSFDIDRPFYPWLRRVAINLCCDERRRLRHKTIAFAELDHPGIEDKHPVHPIYSYSAESRQEMGEMLRMVLGMLPKQHREIIALHHLQGRRYEEIAVILKCTPSAARVKTFRARAALRKLFDEAFAEESCSTSLSIVDRLGACCRYYLTKNPPGSA